MSSGRNHNASESRGERARPHEDLDRAVARNPIMIPEGRSRLARLQEDAGEGGAYNGGHALERGGSGVGDIGVLRIAACTIDCGVWPDGGEAAALHVSP